MVWAAMRRMGVLLVDVTVDSVNSALKRARALAAPSGVRHATGLITIALAGDRVCATSRFEASVLPWFGLPLSLPSQ
jgi:hypothetical protein